MSSLSSLSASTRKVTEATVAQPSYGSNVGFYYNIVLTFAFPAIYAFFVALFVWRIKQAKLASSTEATRNFNTSFQKIVFIQAVTISGLNVGTTLLYAIMQRLPMNPILIIVGYYINYLIFGFPPFIYLAVNRTIRSEFRKIIGQMLWKMASSVYKPPTMVRDSAGMAWTQQSRTIGGNRVPPTLARTVQSRP